MIAKLVLLVRLDRKRPLQSEPSHRPLDVGLPPVLQFVDAVVDGAEGSAPSHARAAVDQHGWAVGRQVGRRRRRPASAAVPDVPLELGLGVADGHHQLQHGCTAVRDIIVGPSKELEVKDDSLYSL